MPQRANVKPITHWVSRQGYTVRFTERRPDHVVGVLNTPDGPVDFTYDAVAQVVKLPDRDVAINEYGWETGKNRNEYGSVTFETPPDAPPSRMPWGQKPRDGQSSEDDAS